MGTIAGGVAHHFNNSIGIILGNTELAMEDVGKYHPGAPFLSEVESAGLRAKKMIQQLVSFSRQSRLEKSCIDIIPVIKDSIGLLKS